MLQEAVEGQPHANPGGDGPPIMRDDWFRDKEGNIIRYSSNLPCNDSIHTHFLGRLKGLEIMLQERELWHNEVWQDCDLKKPEGCCACTLMAPQEDFKSQRSRLEEAAEA